MKKKDIVRSKIEFNNIIQSGKRISNKFFIICYCMTEQNSCSFGIAVGKKIGNAVTRNKIKRQIRNIIDNNLILFPKYHKYIIIKINQLFYNIIYFYFKKINKSFFIIYFT